jgi:hypothetical protein
MQLATAIDGAVRVNDSLADGLRIIQEQAVASEFVRPARFHLKTERFERKLNGTSASEENDAL